MFMHPFFFWLALSLKGCNGLQKVVQRYLRNVTCEKPTWACLYRMSSTPLPCSRGLRTKHSS
ncbi:hypothetical protein M758_4G042700 [Ceratodon purpureus]|uniref:Secreted protein n=1 Tax=Ceratodon purpureus TaxID=3225 RepID=A0A8T0I6Y3_CERPU|nr:hypothetical protein KC19_4G045700 [Ceratodon purpureus]KAG0618140.1 hypothetical protein M758_4G042700 [Ceratodon purpureus]